MHSAWTIPLFFFAVIQPGETDTPPTPTPPTLKTQLESYFRIEKAGDRAKSTTVIAENHRFQEVAAELPRLELWSKPQNSNDWTIALPSGTSVRTTARLPQDYEPSKPIPLIVAFPQPDGSADSTISALMNDPKIQHAWVAVDKPVGGAFYQPVSAANDLPMLLREFRRRVHTDVDRTYIIGEQAGADAAWMAAIMYPHPFAGLIAFAGIPRVPYAEQTYPFLLPNLRGTPLLAVWTEDTKDQPPTLVPAVNAAIARFAITARLPFETVTLAQRDSGVRPIPQRVIAATISKARENRSTVELWFRYLPQGNAGWLRATDLAGDVWNDEQISIAVNAKEDRDEFIAEAIKQKLFSVTGHIDGQAITIDTKRVGAIELRLSPEQIDFSQPVTIAINGRKRFEGMLEPSTKDLLDSAYEDWDFQHLVYLRKSFSINAKP